MSTRIAAHVTCPHSNQLTTKLKNKNSCSSMIHQQMHNNANVNVLFQKYTKQLLTYYHYNRPKKTYPADQLLNFRRFQPTSSGFTFLPGDVIWRNPDCFGPPRFGTSAKIMEIWTCADGKMFMSTFFFWGGPSPILVEHVPPEKQKKDE